MRAWLRPRPNFTLEEITFQLKWQSPDRASVLPELTEQEERDIIEKAIQSARQQKGQAIYNKLYNRGIREPLLIPSYDAAGFRHLLVELGNARAKDRGWGTTFTIDKWNESIISSLCLYFTNDYRFEEVPGMSLKKGILLTGPIGCGKTELMRLLHENPKQSYTVHKFREISDEYSDKEKGGPAIIAKYSNNSQNHDETRHFGQSWLGRYFDDLGDEPEGRHFGNQRSVVESILEARESQFPHYFTHCTTNLTLQQIDDMYGSRIADRIRGMFNILSYSPEAPSRR